MSTGQPVFSQNREGEEDGDRRNPTRYETVRAPPEEEAVIGHVHQAGALAFLGVLVDFAFVFGSELHGSEGNMDIDLWDCQYLGRD